MKKKIVLSTTLVAVFIVVGLFGCGGGGSSNPNPAPVDNSSSPAPVDNSPNPEFVDNSPDHITPPQIASTTSGTDVPLNSAISVTFDKDVDPETINSNTFLLKTTIGEQIVAATVVYDTTTRTAILSPGGSLSPGTSYTATVTNKVTDMDGNYLSGNNTDMSYSWDLTTGGDIDLTPPVVLSLFPKNRATCVSVDTSFVIKFNESIRPLGFSTIEGQPVVITYTEDSTVVTIKPIESLKVGLYSMDFRAQDLAGNIMPEWEKWSFTTTCP